MTLNGVIDLTSPNRIVKMSPNLVAFWTDYVKVVEDTRNTFCSGNVGQRT